MTKRNMGRFIGAFLSLSLLVSPVAVAGADNDDAPEIRVVNNHTYQVQVLVIDQNGDYHPLGRLAPKSARIFTVAAAAEGPVQVKLVVDEPVWSPGNTEEAVRTSDVVLGNGANLQVWIEPDLTSSLIEVVQ